MKKQQLCISISKRNKHMIELLEDYSLEFNLPKAATIYRVLREYNKLRMPRRDYH